MEGDLHRRQRSRKRAYFNPRPPHGGRPCARITILVHTAISIHALRMEGDPPRLPPKGSDCLISIHALRMEGDESDEEWLARIIEISIHALRMEGDEATERIEDSAANFNPRPPHGGRLRPKNSQKRRDLFQSTPSAWRATSRFRFQIFKRANFNPRPPHGGRPSYMSHEADLWIFQSTPSAWRATSTAARYSGSVSISIHALRMEGDFKSA